MPLAMVNTGEEVVLKAINWGPKMKKRLQDMGLTPGVKINVISNDTNGSFIINVRGSRLVLGGVVAQQIIVN
ncbi:FeoA family protein [Tepidibacter thalassicus]|uniref:Ferrous iron transport protein A n=1 Tax=Tepidibacter thalassicus DSM 15285 TaxID=1123350 RepID=A0A1M5QMQ5_9FIRM|nr:FeoA family protein [Tepidibacter thalassicus]SHH15010.1 ferrous iron transport protein A [Tepidibacter thalassicus DSM 15285]